MVVLARKRALNYAFNPGKSADEHMLGLDKRKAPSVIGKAVKSAGPGAKVSTGTCEVSGKVMTLTTETVLPGMAKKLKAFLKENKLPMKVVIQDPAGNVLEQDGEGEPEAEEAPAAAPPAEPVPEPAPESGLAEELLARAEELGARAAELPKAARSKIEEALDKVPDLARKGAGPQAGALLDKVEAALDKLAGSGAGAQILDALRQKHQKLAEQAAALPETPLLAKIETALEDLAGLIRAEKPKAGAKLAATLETALAKIPAAEPAADSGPADRLKSLTAELKELAQRVTAMSDAALKKELSQNVRDAAAALKAKDAEKAAALLDDISAGLEGTEAPQELSPLWRDARDAAGAQIGALQDALRSHGADLFGRIADKGLNGITKSQLTAMQAAVFDMDAAKGPDRAAAAAKLRKAIAAMREFLEKNRGVQLLERNPLGVEITLIKILGGALDEISARMPQAEGG